MNIRRNNYGLKLSPITRILYGIIGLLCIAVDVGILYVMYATAAWVTAVLQAPYVVTWLLILFIALFTGGVVIILLVAGAMGIYGALVG